jgi:hypothetical protein
MEEQMYNEEWEKYIRMLADHHGKPEPGISPSERRLFKAGVIVGGNDVLEDYTKALDIALNDSTQYTGAEVKKMLRIIKPIWPEKK